MTAKLKTVPVSTRALIQRINRKLASQDEQLRASRGQRAQQDLGTYYVVDVRRNAVASSDVDLEALGREVDALRPWESWDQSDR